MTLLLGLVGRINNTLWTHRQTHKHIVEIMWTLYHVSWLVKALKKPKERRSQRKNKKYSSSQMTEKIIQMKISSDREE